MPDRTRARQLAAQYLAQGDPLGWFEPLYREAEEGKGPPVPWVQLQPNPNLMDFWKQHPIHAEGNTALAIGCGLGDDAEQLSAWGFSTTAFDISETAIRACRRRFPQSKVQYIVGDLLRPPETGRGSFDFVVEIYTLQVLPPEFRVPAMERVEGFVKRGGKLLVIARGRDENEPCGEMPWPLTRRELEYFAGAGLTELSFEDFYDSEHPPARRFRVLYSRPER
jgi:hypothetical protein